MEGSLSNPRKIYLFSDSGKLSRAIELTIRSLGSIEACPLEHLSLNSAKLIDINLVILAISRPTVNGEVMGILASLSPQTQKRQRTPVLLVSDSPKNAEFSRDGVFQMHFPFDAQVLYDVVVKILEPVEPKESI